MHKRATKQETELRVAHAAELVAEGQAYSSITSLVAAKYGISRRRARQITSNAYLLLKDDIEEGDLNRPEMTAKLVCTLETAMFRAMQEKQYSAVASNAKVLIKLIGLEASRPINLIRTFALLATAEYCFSCIALNIAVSRVHTNFAVISGRFKSPSSISSFSKR